MCVVVTLLMISHVDVGVYFGDYFNYFAVDFVANCMFRLWFCMLNLLVI